MSQSVIHVDPKNEALVKELNDKFPKAEKGIFTCRHSFGGFVCTRPNHHTQPSFHVAHGYGGEPIALVIGDAALPAEMLKIAQQKEVPPQVTIKPPKSLTPEPNDVIVAATTRGRYLVLNTSDVIRLADNLKENPNMLPVLRIDVREMFLTWAIFKPEVDKLEKSNA